MRLSEQDLSQFFTGHKTPDKDDIARMVEEIRTLRQAQSDLLYDSAEAGVVEVETNQQGKLWVNVDGRCRIRIGKVSNVVIDSPRLRRMQELKE